MSQEDSSASQFVTVRHFATLINAELACSRLEAAGIAAYIRDAHTSSILGAGGGSAIGGVRLEVAAADADRSSTLLQELLDQN